MTKLNEIYRCNVCGNIIEVVHGSSGELVCCNQPMELLNEKTEDKGNEKHVPFIKGKEGSDYYLVQIGEVEHPMEEKHYIEWIEFIVDGRSYKKYLKPGQKPLVEFKIPVHSGEKFVIREYCSLHGLWKLDGKLY